MDEHNPYAAPAAAVAEPIDATPTAVAPLFRVSGIGIATFFATPIAGGIVMALNERALGRPERVWPVIVLSFVASLVFMGLAFVLPEQVPSLVFTVAQLAAMTQVAKAQQGAQIDARIAAGMAMRSNWRALALSLLVLAALLALIALGVFAALRWYDLTWNEFLQGLAAAGTSGHWPVA